MATPGTNFRAAPTIAGSQSAPVATNAAYPLQAALSRPSTPPAFHGGRPVAAGAPAGNLKAAAPDPVKYTRNVLLAMGTVLVVLVVIVPVWNSLMLLSDPVFVFFIGRKWPLWIIAACFAAVVSWALGILFFFKFAREETLRDTSILTIGTIIITALGLALVLLSLPVLSESQAAYQSIIGNCEFSAKTRGLYSYVSVLQGIRSQPDCVDKESIEHCQGYQESQPYTGFLKAMEMGSKCSGFCSGDASMAAGTAAWAASAPVPAPAPSPRGTLAKAMHRVVVNAGASATRIEEPSSGGAVVVGGGANEEEATGGRQITPAQIADAIAKATVTAVEADEEEEAAGERQVTPARLEGQSDDEVMVTGRRAGLLQENSTRQVGAAPELGSRPYAAAPTLFTGANYDASCDGLAAWDIHFTGEHTANLFYQQGVILLFCTVMVGMLKIVQTCAANHPANKGSKLRQERQDVQRQHLQQQIQQRFNPAPIVT